MLYGAYDHLVNHCLRTNLTRGVKLAKALLSGRHKVELPINYRKTFTMYLGTGYLLLENYRDAKIKLEECLNDDPSEIIKGCALNNLGVACWWHKHPKFQETQKSESKDSQE
jgi:Tfp pilus assembly protein PilF